MRTRVVVAIACGAFVAGVYVAQAVTPETAPFSIDTFVNSFDKSKIKATKVGHEYWFVDKILAEGKTLKMSVVGPRLATHPPHTHVEDEFFFILEGTAELYLGGQKKVVGPMTSLYCPTMVEHGIKNAGDTELKYLVIKEYPDAGAAVSDAKPETK